eukprot:Nitzschia sp. Nitz4//scaffold346_size17405//55//2740//NITZ4_008827-RA/size17405-processed-gene-0.3-mRNA-1//-1//CDS//3329548641//1284//frame0
MTTVHTQNVFPVEGLDGESLSGSDPSSRGQQSSTSVDTPTSSSREDFVIGKDENKAVLRIRFAVAIFLLLCTVGAAALVYLFTKRQEQKEFERDFLGFSTKILGSLATAFAQTFATVDMFAVSMISYTNAANLTWPFVILPNSATRMVKVLNVARASAMAFLPSVSAQDLHAWNTFSMTNAHVWIEEHLSVQEAYTGFSTDLNVSDFKASPIYNGDGSLGEERDSYFPFWQPYPIVSSESVIYNYDYTSESSERILPGSGDRVTRILEKGYAMLSDVVNAQAGSYVDEYKDTFTSTEPASEIHYPIFDSAADDVFIRDRAGWNQSQMIGFVWISIYWRNEMMDLLPSGVNGLVFVVSTSTNNSFTYQLDGPDVVFLGFGDHHDSQYDDYVIESNISGLDEYKSGSTLYTGLNLSEELCKYTFRLYPSASFESKYVTANPWVYTSVTVIVFIFTTMVFFVYDWLVERRQKTVLNTAMKSSAIVSSLFPKNVRTRLLDMAEEKGNQPKHSTQKSKLKTFMAEISGGTDDEGSTGKTEGMAFDSRPIADLFPEATVMFADIVGFTAWSSTREPSQVFILLESVYGSFDKLAAKRGVFKVETIGDCYMAVAGLPDPRKDHAVVITKFAQDCHHHMRRLVSKLSVTLGPETEDMTMRIGLNSGPVTAGVLRGQKSRFQLFGDTVNTASRMESTGKKECIQVSPSTADALRQLGKGHWLRPRTDVVEIKGKGQMATFWVNVHEKAGSSLSNNDDDARTGHAKITGKHENLVKWNVDVLSKLLGAVLARRKARGIRVKGAGVQATNISLEGSIPIDEVREIIELPGYDAKLEDAMEQREVLNPIVMSQLHDFVSDIAMTYHDDNPFHNFAQ